MDWLQGILSWSEAREVLRIDLLGELVLACVLGGVVGWERESSGKPAGLRTNIMICVGATLLTDLSIAFAQLSVSDVVRADPARIAAQIVSGIGFLGAGTILQSRGTVVGLTTAATLWVVAAIGMTIGAGAHVEATGATLLVLVVLWPLGWVEDRIEHARRGRTVRITLTDVPGKVDEIQALMEEAGLIVRMEALEKGDGAVQVTFEVRGRSREFRKVRSEIEEMAEVRGIYRT